MQNQYLFFSTLIKGENSISFYTHPTDDKYKPLIYLITDPRIKGTGFYHSLLAEVKQIIKGDKVKLDEEIGLRDFWPTGDLYVQKDKTILELYNENAKAYETLELPTENFKFLLESWIKFVEVNTQAFSKE